MATRRGARACGGCCAARWFMGTQQDVPSHDEDGGEPVKPVSRDFVCLMSIQEWTFPLIHVFMETDFSYGYLHTDSKKCRRKGFPSFLFFFSRCNMHRFMI